MYGIYEGGQVIAKFVAPMSVKTEEPSFSSDSLSLKRRIEKRPAQRWSITSPVEPLSFGAHKLFSLLVRKGHSGLFTIVTPQNYGVIKARTSTGGIVATGSAGASSVAIGGNTGLLPDGTFVKFANHSKVYMLTADRNGDGSVGIYPELRVSVSATTMSYKEDVFMSCRLETDILVGMTFTDGILMDNGSLTFKEDV
jgi:hypothetical protein